MTITSTTQYALFAALANRPMSLTSWETEINAENTANAIGILAQDNGRYGKLSGIAGLTDGWEVTPITEENIQDAIDEQAARLGVAAYDNINRDYDGMGAYLFVNHTTGEAVISYRGTQLEDGYVAMGADIQADLALGNFSNAVRSDVPDQVYAAYYFYLAV